MTKVEAEIDRTGLRLYTGLPFNAETEEAALVASWITPTERFFHRNHAPIPVVDPTTYRLTVDGFAERTITLTLDELKRLPRATTTATLQCAGNRRSEFTRDVIGEVPWTNGAIGNAEWAGARLADVLAMAGVKPEAKHAWFAGVDLCHVDGNKTVYGGSAPLAKALRGECLLAMEINGAPLSSAHGFPVRTIIPGFIAARSVKWLDRITLADRPSDNYFQAKAYKMFPPEIDHRTADWANTPPIDAFPISAAICSPTEGARVRPGPLTVRGYAVSDGGDDATVACVEVSADEGRTWIEARFDGPAMPFAWRLWSAEIVVSTSTDRLIARAVDSRGRMQPEKMAWNFKGYLYNGWQRLSVNVER